MEKPNLWVVTISNYHLKSNDQKKLVP